jgi:hypothetical protein
MICKYCHENTHYIDVCPIIICKICKDIGHPQWLCIKKKNNNKLSNNNLNKTLSDNKILNDNNTKKDLNYINKKDLDDNKKILNLKNESSDNLSDKNLSYYIKNINESWDILFI